MQWSLRHFIEWLVGAGEEEEAKEKEDAEEEEAKEKERGDGEKDAVDVGFRENKACMHG